MQEAQVWSLVLELDLTCHSSVRFSSVTQSCPTLCNPMDCSTPDFPIYHQLQELTQTHVHWVSDAIQPPHPPSSPSPPAPNPSQHQGLSQWICSLHHVAKELELQLQHQSFPWTFRIDFLQDWLVLSPCSPRDSQESSPAPVRKHQFFSTQPLLWSNSQIYTWLLQVVADRLPD